jgi:hypothetical protein
MEALVSVVVLAARAAALVVRPFLPAPPKVIDPPKSALHLYTSGEEPPDLLVSLISRQLRLYG